MGCKSGEGCKQAMWNRWDKLGTPVSLLSPSKGPFVIVILKVARWWEEARGQDGVRGRLDHSILQEQWRDKRIDL